MTSFRSERVAALRRGRRRFAAVPGSPVLAPVVLSGGLPVVRWRLGSSPPAAEDVRSRSETPIAVRQRRIRRLCPGPQDGIPRLTPCRPLWDWRCEDPHPASHRADMAPAHDRSRALQRNDCQRIVSTRHYIKQRDYQPRRIMPRPYRGQRQNAGQIVDTTPETTDLLRCMFLFHVDLYAGLRSLTKDAA